MCKCTLQNHEWPLNDRIVSNFVSAHSSRAKTHMVIVWWHCVATFRLQVNTWKYTSDFHSSLVCGASFSIPYLLTQCRTMEENGSSSCKNYRFVQLGIYSRLLRRLQTNCRRSRKEKQNTVADDMLGARNHFLRFCQWRYEERVWLPSFQCQTIDLFLKLHPTKMMILFIWARYQPQHVHKYIILPRKRNRREIVPAILLSSL